MVAARHFRTPWHTGRNQSTVTALPRRTPRRVRAIIAGGNDMRAHQPGSTPIDIPETVPNPAHTTNSGHGHSGQADSARRALAEWLRGTADRIDPARVPLSPGRFGRGSLASSPASLCLLLQRDQDAPVTGKGCPGFSRCPAARGHYLTHYSRGASPP